MSEENVEIVLEFLRLAEANDVEGAAALMHPEITGTAAPGWPEQGPFVGRDAAVAETKRLTDWGETRVTDIDVAAAVRVKEGRIIEWHNRWSRDEALEAAGLSE